MDAERQRLLDEEHLRLLAIGYKISAAITGFYSLFGLFYVLMGAFVAMVPFESSAGEPPPQFFALFMGIIGLSFMAVGITIGLLKWRTALNIERRQSLVFCQVIAGLSCLEVPYGTALGVFTFLVLGRPSVRAMFT